MNRDKLIELCKQYYNCDKCGFVEWCEKDCKTLDGIKGLADHLIANGIGYIAEIADKGERILDWESIRKENWSKEQIELYEIIKAYEHKDLATLAVNYFDDICTSKIKYEALQAENLKLTEQLKNSVVLPCKVGDTVYAIAKCCDVARKLDGSYYSSDGSPGTATGWYCAFDGKEDKCPLCGEDDCNEKDYAIFETEVLDLNYCENSECNGWQIYLENFDTYESYYFTKTEAEARLAELKEEV